MATATAVSAASTHPLKWLAAPSSCSTYSSALRRASSLMTTGSLGGCCSLLIRGLLSSGPGQPGGERRPRGAPHHQAVAVLSELEEGSLQPSQAQDLGSPHGHAEDHLAQHPLHRLPLAGALEAQVLARGRARARDRPERQAAVLEEGVLLGHRLVVHRVAPGDREIGRAS